MNASSLDIDRAADLDYEISALATTIELQAVLGDPRHTHRPLTPESPERDDRIPREWYTQAIPVLREAVFGAALILVLLFRPLGILGDMRRDKLMKKLHGR